ncbi:MAG: hypothetical protein NC548_24790 [Lachnospiraceae bacterium]|nr:hypothetical protein [Lachnospiraceae bacterium]
MNKIKNLFSLLFKKVKNFIAIFDSNGNILPVVSLHAVVDHFSKSRDVNVYAPKEISDSVIEAGGNGCENTPHYFNDTESYDEVSEDSIEFKNFMSLAKVLKEHYNVNVDMKELNERSSYSKPGEKLNIPLIDTKEFEDMLEERIFDRQSGENEIGNLLIFGAPGIGKSTIANTVIKNYNKSRNSSEKIAMITVNCANLAPGDFMMPSIPMKKNLSNYFERNADIPVFAELNNLSDEETKEFQNALDQQKVSDSSPKSWLPCYKPTGNDTIDAALDMAANGGIIKDKKNAKNNQETGSGGIILFDELFRADPAIFNQLMTFLLEREMDGWMLGSKWAIIACSNRPADSKRVSTIWQEIEGADLDRWADVALLKPNPESWKDYMRNIGLTGENEIIFKFIFDPDSKDGDEYPRWHSVDSKEDMDNDSSTGNEKSDAYTLPVTPRRWETVWKTLKRFMNRKGYKSIVHVPIKELSDAVKTNFTPDFLHEFIDWIEQHTGNVDLNDILDDPTSVYPRKDIKTDDTVIIKDLWEQFEKRYGKKQDCPDEELKNVFIWLGMHFAEQANLVDIEFIQQLDKVLQNAGENSIATKEETVKVMMAAFPSRDDFEGDLEGVDEVLDEVKDLMREYFPWRIKGDEIQFIDDYED